MADNRLLVEDLLGPIPKRIRILANASVGLFAAGSLLGRRRGTHTPMGIGARGRFLASPDPAFPAPAVFADGVEWPAVVRYGSGDFGDASALDFRSMSLRLRDQRGSGFFDLLCNTGDERSFFPHALSFVDFVRTRVKGGEPEHYEWFFGKHPRSKDVLVSMQRRNPESHALLHYYNQVIFGLHAQGHDHWVRFRILPEDDREDTGVPDDDDRNNPYDQDRREGDRRPRSWLVDDVRRRIDAGGIVHRVQAQVHRIGPGDGEEWLDLQDTWPDHPWLEVGRLWLDEVVEPEDAERLSFNVDVLPEGLSVLPAKGLRDPNSLVVLRALVYQRVQQARRAGQRFRGPPEVTPNDPQWVDPDDLESVPENFAMAADQLGDWYSRLPPSRQQSLTRNLIDEITEEGGLLAPHEKNLTHRAAGRIVFDRNHKNGDPVPMHHCMVELWDRDVGTPDDFLGRAMTDADGRFEVWYDPADAGPMDLPDLELRVFEPTHKFDNGDQPTVRWKRIYAEKGDDDVTVELYDFGTVRVPYWEYDPDWPFPRIYVPPEGDPPTAYSAGRSVLMAKVVAPLEAIRKRHQLKVKMGKALDISEIQLDYPASLTSRLERENPGHTRSDRFFGERMMNGMCASVFDRDPDNPERLRIYHHWNSYEQDGIHCLPNVDMRFELQDDIAMPVEIRLDMREPGATVGNAPVTNHTLRPGDGVAWEAAKRIARVSASLNTELGGHLAHCHLNVEQYAIAAYRQLRINPVRWLLTPHLKEVVLINRSASNFLLGPNGFITRGSALTEKAIYERLGQVMGTLDWKGFEPAAPISDKHVYAHAAGLYWKLTRDFVDDFFQQFWADIVERWIEVKRFSDDLVEHAPEVYLCSYLRREILMTKGRKGPRKKPPAWFNDTERMDVWGEHPEVEERTVAVSRITEVEHNPGREDIDNLKQVCTYVIFHATFRHAWANNRQHDDGGEVAYAGLGLRWGEKGVLVPESDLSVAPEPLMASEQVWISAMLSKTMYGFVIQNEEQDISPRFVDALKSYASVFESFDLDLETVQSRINI